MLQHLIVLLDDTSISFCNYENKRTDKKLISLNNLNNGILFAMKNNLIIQFVFPDYDLPIEYKLAIESIENSKIVSTLSCQKESDIIVFNKYDELSNYNFEENTDKLYVLHTSKNNFFNNYKKVIKVLDNITRLNIVFTDIADFTDFDFEIYKNLLNDFRTAVIKCCENSKFPQLNILTDRILLDKMNNCNAGIENITLAPNGKFYICPAFYYEEENDYIHSVESNIIIKNKQLYKFEFSPICKKCDAFQCKR